MKSAQTPMNPQGRSSPKRYRGEVVYIYAYDLAYDTKREPLGQLLGQPVSEYSIGPSKRSPKFLFFYRPQMITLAPERRAAPGGEAEVRRSIKLFSVGALSIQIRVPFEVERLEDLVSYHDLSFPDASLEEEARRLAEQARAELLPYCIRPVEQLREGEAYTVFWLPELPKGPDGAIPAEQWLRRNRRQVAGLLTQEEDVAHLAELQVSESTGRYLSYYESDLVVVNWDAALVVGEHESFDDVLHIMEMANVQLVELAAYDRILDASLESAYRDISGWTGRSRGRVRRDLRELSVDLPRLGDELVNITKFFGDWHLARIYGGLSSRFHLADWHHAIEEKLSTLGDLYELLQKDRTNLWMVILEASIVLLFIIDVIILLVGLG